MGNVAPILPPAEVDPAARERAGHPAGGRAAAALPSFRRPPIAPVLFAPEVSSRSILSCEFPVHRIGTLFFRSMLMLASAGLDHAAPSSALSQLRPPLPRHLSCRLCSWSRRPPASVRSSTSGCAIWAHSIWALMYLTITCSSQQSNKIIQSCNPQKREQHGS